jgi:predicted RNA polymerase sigma factor
MSDVRRSLAAVFREQAGSSTGTLARYTGAFALAEECEQDAVMRWSGGRVMACRRGPARGC